MFRALLALAIDQPIGAAIDRPRPYTVIPNMHLLVDKTSDFSFASDHSIIAGGVAAGLWLVNRRLGIVATIAAVAMAFARVRRPQRTGLIFVTTELRILVAGYLKNEVDEACSCEPVE